MYQLRDIVEFTDFKSFNVHNANINVVSVQFYRPSYNQYAHRQRLLVKLMSAHWSRCFISRSSSKFWNLIAPEHLLIVDTCFYSVRSFELAVERSWKLWWYLAKSRPILLFMVALCNRADLYIFMLWLLLSFFPRLISGSEIGCLPYFHTWCGPSVS